MKWISNMFGFIVTQPIEKTLVQMRVINIMALGVTYHWAEELLNKIPHLTADSDTVIVGVYLANFATLIAVFWKAINDINKPID